MTCDGSDKEKLMTFKERRKLINANKRKERDAKRETLAVKQVERVSEPEKVEVTKKKSKQQFKVPPLLKRFSNKSKKKDDLVTVQYLTAKREVKWKICKVIGGDVIVINNKVHKLNPMHLWIHKKKVWYIIREIDRRPVSNEDYPAVVAAGMDTDADTPLIKAVLGAVKKDKKEVGDKKFLVLGVIVLVVVAIIVYLFAGGSP